MIKFNFFERPRAAALELKSGEQIVDEIVLSKLAGDLESSELNLAKLQHSFDAIFTKDRRRQILSQTGSCSDGSPAIYFRYMKRSKFIEMLRKSEHLPSHYNEINEQTDVASSLDYFLKDFYSHEIEKATTFNQEQQNKFYELPLNEKFYYLFPQVNRDLINKLITRLDVTELQNFFDVHAPNEFKRVAHRIGGFGQMFSPYLSASAGAPILAFGSLENDLVYIEFVAPDDAVLMHSKDFDRLIVDIKGGEIEKEVLFRKIPISWVTRVYLSSDLMMDDIERDGQSAVNRFAVTQGHTGETTEAKYQNWVNKADTKDYVSVSVLKKFGR